jgi:ABC-type antimicrobial peptide transport system permease subunit
MKIFSIVLLRAAAMGLAGGALGLVAGLALGQKMAVDSGAPMILMALLVAPALSLVASWIPALIATQQDPAEILRKE